MACTEVQLAQRIVDGVASLIKVEDQLTGGRSDAATLGARAVPQVAPLTIPLPPKSPGIWGLNPSTDLHEGGGAESSGVATPVWVNSSSSSQAGGGGEENSATVRSAPPSHPLEPTALASVISRS